MGLRILAIESSCDDTSAAIIHDGNILSNIVCNQSVHEKWGGVVPELASRAHLQNIVPTVKAALDLANTDLTTLDAVACTIGPGLVGSLLVGVNFTKSLSQCLQIPFIGVNHMQAHILAHFIDDPKPSFPFLCLVVSGGHTQIVIVHDFFSFELVGETLDDAAGEAFDKSAKILQLPYPGGPLIDLLAKNGNSLAFEFAKPQIKNLDFSFSGVKTSILYFLQKKLTENPDFITQNLNDLCASIQKTIIDILMQKLIKASKQFNINEIAICGGVSANSLLRDELSRIGNNKKWNTYIPKFEYCTDNAAMIAITAHYKYLHGKFDTLDTLPLARFNINS
jgi:N6-L-threonylcarbamoyladenine synthase